MILLDNGHGGIINGIYQTPGKRSPKWNDGRQLFEGDFNREIVKIISKKLNEKGIKYKILVPELEDISLSERVKRANVFGKNNLYVSIHSNAGGGSGFEVFTSLGETKSDKIATIFGEEFKKIFPDKKLRSNFSDGDLDKEAKFTVITKTIMPAILTENFFMDNEDECKSILLSDIGRNKIAEFHVNAIEMALKLYPELAQ